MQDIEKVFFFKDYQNNRIFLINFSRNSSLSNFLWKKLIYLVWPVMFLCFLWVSSSNILPHIFSIQVKSGVCYIMGQSRWVQNKINLTLALTLNLLLFFLIILIKLCVFIMIVTASSFLQLIYDLFFMRRICHLDCMLLWGKIPHNTHQCISIKSILSFNFRLH